LVIVRRSFGGRVETQAAVFVLSFLSLAASSLAYYNVKRLQIEQHRAWMLRTMVYVSLAIKAVSTANQSFRWVPLSPRGL